MATAKQVGDAIKAVAKTGYQYRNYGSAAAFVFGYPQVAAFLSSPEMPKYVEKYGVPAEQVWDAMFDTEATWRGRPMDLSERTLRSIAKYVVDEDIKLADGAQWLLALGDYVVDKQLPMPTEAELAMRLLGYSMQGQPGSPPPEPVAQFVPNEEGGILITPSGKEFREEEVVYFRDPEFAAMHEKKEVDSAEKNGGMSAASGFVLGVASALALSFAWRRLRG